MYRIPLFLCLLLSFAFIHCNKPGRYSSPPGYNLQQAYQIKLPLELDEISGVAYYPKDTSVFAINDERGWLYKLSVGRKKGMMRWEFSNGADFEDIVLLDSIFYILQSNGDINRVAFVDSSALISKKFPFKYKQDNEFEILYYDDSRKKLIMICKDCESDKKKSLTTYTFDPVTNEFSDASFSIDVTAIAASLQKKKIRFKPSAATINPADSMLYIISSVNKLLVITDRNGVFKKAYSIDPALFKQPEGISFTPSGTLIISNESAGVGVANILIFSFGKTPS